MLALRPRPRTPSSRRAPCSDPTERWSDPGHARAEPFGGEVGDPLPQPRRRLPDGAPDPGARQACLLAGANPCERRRPDARMTWVTALIRARWVKACGKLPRCRP